MKTITYKFSTGRVNKVEVSEAFYLYYSKLVKADRLIDRRETRRHVSLDRLVELGIEPTVSDEEERNGYFRFNDLRLEREIKRLSSSQRKLLWQIYGERFTQSEVAEMENVTVSAIHYRLKRILKKLYKNLA